MKTHEMTGTRFYGSWLNMKSRCDNPSTVLYSRYGGRGIKYDKKWSDFNTFKADMYPSYLLHVAEYGEKNTSIDREDNSKGYTKNNCRWATRHKQSRNIDCNLSYKGEVAVDAGRRLGGSIGLISARVNILGWSLKDAFTRPIGVSGGSSHTHNKMFSYKGKTQTMSDWAKDCGLPYTAIRARLRRGWSVEKAISTPSKLQI